MISKHQYNILYNIWGKGKLKPMDELVHADHGYYWSNFILHKLPGLDTQIVLLWRQQFIKLVVVRHWIPEKHVTDG